jgi:polar amino acid transport system substrate-binding protein
MVGIIASGCASASNEATKAALQGLKPATTALPPPTTAAPTVPSCDATASLRPAGPLPTPGQMPAGSTMAEIQKRGFLRVGVDENTLQFSARDPKTGELVGFEVDLAHKIAQAIFGNPDAIKLVTVVTAQKVPFVKDHTVDLTISGVSMTCARWQDVEFSTEYFTAFHKLLVRNDSTISGIQDLAGRKVCVTIGSSSVGILTGVAPKAIQVPKEARSDCLLALQEGEVEAYFSHDAILYGMQLQDPNTKILPDAVSAQHYGIAIAKDHDDFVRFVNALLEQMRADGSLGGLVDSWLRDLHPAPIPEPHYQG